MGDRPEFRAFLGNGYIGMRVDSKPVSSGKANCTTYLSGLKYGKDEVKSIKCPTSKLCKPVELADFANTLFRDAETGQSLLDEHPWTSYEEVLDMRKAELRKVIETSTVHLEEDILLNRFTKNLIIQRFALIVRRNLKLRMEMGFSDVTSVGLQTVDAGILDDGDVLFLKQTTVETNIPVGYASKLVFSPVLSVEKVEPTTSGKLAYTVLLQPGTVLEFYRVTCICEGREEEEPLDAACRRLRHYTWEDIVFQVSAHYDSWLELWNRRVELENEHFNQRSLVMQYNLLSSHREDNKNSVPALGISGAAWNAFVFPWDAMLWMFPYYLVAHTEMAKAMLDYEVTAGPHYGFHSRLDYYSSGQANKMYEGGCVAFAAWQYYLVTKDEDWLFDIGWRIIKAAAEGYGKRAVYNQELDKFEIKDIWPVDEWGSNSSSNDVFTNGLGNLVVQIAHKAAGLTGNSFSGEMEQILNKIREKGFWLPFDPVNNRHIEYGEYVNQQIVNCYNGELIKQADTNLLTFPLEVVADEEYIRNNFDYYKTRVDPRGPEMTWGIYATIAAQLEREEEVLEALQRIESYLKTEFLLFSEASHNNNTVFHTGAGDYMQAMIFGLGGLRIRQGEVYFKPMVSKCVAGDIRLHCVNVNGESYDVSIGSFNRSIRLKGRQTRAFIYTSGTKNTVINRFFSNGLRDLEGTFGDGNIFRVVETGLTVENVCDSIEVVLTDLTLTQGTQGYLLRKVGGSCLIRYTGYDTIKTVICYKPESGKSNVAADSLSFVQHGVFLPDGDCIVKIDFR